MKRFAGLLSMALGLFFVVPAAAVPISLNAQWEVAFGMGTPPPTQRIGHLTSLKIGTTVVGADMMLRNPMGGAIVPTVGAIESLYWETGAADPIAISGYISTMSRNQIAQLLASVNSTTPVVVSFVVYNYAQVGSAYYIEFKPQAPTLLTGTFVFDGTAPRVSLATDPAEVPGTDVQIYNLYFEIKPKGRHDLIFRTSPTASVLKRWGI